MKFLFPLILIGFLSGCAGYGVENISHHEKILILDDAITASVQGGVVAYDAGYITKRDLCKITEYADLAGAIVDQAWLALFQQDYDGVVDYLDRARLTLQGVTAAAQERVDYHCAGTA